MVFPRIRGPFCGLLLPWGTAVWPQIKALSERLNPVIQIIGGRCVICSARLFSGGYVFLYFINLSAAYMLYSVSLSNNN